MGRGVLRGFLICFVFFTIIYGFCSHSPPCLRFAFFFFFFFEKKKKKKNKKKKKRFSDFFLSFFYILSFRDILWKPLLTVTGLAIPRHLSGGAQHCSVFVCFVLFVFFSKMREPIKACLPHFSTKKKFMGIQDEPLQKQ